MVSMILRPMPAGSVGRADQSRRLARKGGFAGNDARAAFARPVPRDLVAVCVPVIRCLALPFPSRFLKSVDKLPIFQCCLPERGASISVSGREGARVTGFFSDSVIYFTPVLPAVLRELKNLIIFGVAFSCLVMGGHSRL
jgi:hypothetical protein